MSPVLATIYDSLSLGNVFLLLLLFFLLHYLIVLYEFRNMPPGPRLSSLPVLGNIFSLDLNADRMPDTFKSLKKTYGDIFSLKVGSYNLIMASSSEAVNEMLVKKSADFSGRSDLYTFYKITLGGKDIVFGNYGPAWRFYRKLFITALRQYVSDSPLIESRVSPQAEKLIHFMEQQNGAPFDPADCLQRIVADVVCGIIFQDGLNTKNPDMDKLLKLNVKFAESADAVKMAFILDFFRGARHLPIKARQDRIVQLFYDMYDIIRKLLRERKETFDPSEPVEDFMSALLRARYDLDAECKSDEERSAVLSEDYFIAAIEDMFLAGFESTSTTMRFALAFLANHPNYQEDIQRQLDEVLDGRSPSLEDRLKLPLIQAMILETLRLGNVVPLAIPHVALTDTTLGGYRVPKDTVIFANTEAVHLDPKCWEDPTVFNPYRHTDADGKLITNQGNFYPFGAGRRVCAGESLAKVELFLFSSWLLQNFTFLPAEGHPPKSKASIIQFPQRYKIRAIKRN